jgi:hypothetical protein
VTNFWRAIDYSADADDDPIAINVGDFVQWTPGGVDQSRVATPAS